MSHWNRMAPGQLFVRAQIAMEERRAAGLPLRGVERTVKARSAPIFDAAAKVIIEGWHRQAAERAAATAAPKYPAVMVYTAPAGAIRNFTAPQFRQ